jgi:hypothetical protein
MSSANSLCGHTSTQDKGHIKKVLEIFGATSGQKIHQEKKIG